ncbi:MAG: hypothetical protein ABSE73_00255 [Planctomycetota bacterium]
MMRSVLGGVLVCLVSFSPSAAAGDRDTATALLSTVDASLGKGETASALEICKRALAADSSCPDAYYKMGRCLEQMNKPRDAFKNYKNAAELAKKENDAKMQRTANAAAEKLGTGLIQISDADQKLVPKLILVADEALEGGQLETARQAYAAIVALAPGNEKAKEGLDKAEKAIAARGDPVKAKIAAAMLAEIYYYVASGDKAKATEKAQEAKSKHPDTAAGREAAELLANKFEPPKNLDAQIAEAKRQLKAQAAKKPAPPPPATGTTPSAVAPVVPSGPPPVDVDALEKTAAEDAKKLPKNQLVGAFKEAFAKGKESFAKATPGTEGNQKNLHAALEQFIRCEALFMRLEEEKLATDDVAAMQKQAGMSRYSCMKMTILAH